MRSPSVPVDIDLDIGEGLPPRARLLASLHRAGRPVSGERLARELGVSRAAVNKHIRALRGLGYRIAGTPGRGYLLARRPDRLFPYELLLEGLAPQVKRVVYRSAVGSTNDLARALGEAGASAPAVVLADYQSAGRGRRGRSWVAPPNTSVLLSLLIRPAVAPGQVPLFSLLAALAAAEALEELCGVCARVKWPNDVLLNGKKCGGVLVEMAGEAETVRHVVIGVGINVSQSAAQLPRDARQAATSVRLACGRAPRRARIAVEVVNRIVACEGGRRLPDDLLLRWRARDVCLGARVAVAAPEGRVEGVGEAVDELGRLVVRRADGARVTCLAGDVTVLGVGRGMSRRGKR